MNFNFTHHTKCSVLFLLVDDINSFPFPFVIIQKKTYCKRLAKAIARGLSHNLELTKCMLIGSSMKLESKVALTASIFDHCVNNVSCFKYLGILLSSDFTWTNHVEDMAGKINQRLGLLRRIKHLLPFRARILFYKSPFMPLFEYADLVCGDKHNVTLMSSLHKFCKLRQLK